MMERRQWLMLLNTRVVSSAQTTPADLNLQLKSYVKGLSDIPQAAFCEESCEAASRQFEFFPAYAAVRKFLEIWHADFLKRTRSDSAFFTLGYDDPTLDDRDRSYIKTWADKERNFPEERRRIELSATRQWAPKAYAYIIRTDAEAARIAYELNWLTKHQDALETSELGLTHDLVMLEQLAGDGPVGRALASFGLKVLRTSVERQAPEMLALIPARIEPGRGLRALEPLGDTEIPADHPAAS